MEMLHTPSNKDLLNCRAPTGKGQFAFVLDLVIRTVSRLMRLG